MSSIDPEVLYLILTKVAAKEAFYSLEAGHGTITRKQLGEVYERITGSRVGSRVNWEATLTQLHLLLKTCALPPIGVVLTEEGSTVDASKGDLYAVHKVKWPTFSALKAIYAKKSR